MTDTRVGGPKSTGVTEGGGEGLAWIYDAKRGSSCVKSNTNALTLSGVYLGCFWRSTHDGIVSAWSCRGMARTYVAKRELIMTDLDDFDCVG